MNSDLNLFYPLNEFYELSGLSLPSGSQIEGSDVPEPYRTLLVHHRDMTPTLADAYGQNIRLRVIRKQVYDHVYARLIALEAGSRPVLFGAIKIYLEHFPPSAKGLVLEGRQPFGAILQSEGISHTSRPDAYIQVTADAIIQEALGLSDPHVLYGRRNVLWNTSRHAIAQVLEILPPSGGTAV